MCLRGPSALLRAWAGRWVTLLIVPIRLVEPSAFRSRVRRSLVAVCALGRAIGSGPGDGVGIALQSQSTSSVKAPWSPANPSTTNVYVVPAWASNVPELNIRATKSAGEQVPDARANTRMSRS